MGLCSSQPAAPPAVETIDVQYTRLKAELEETKVKSKEATNLLRYKVEVLVNMLAIEEKKTEALNVRLDSTKLMMLSKGLTEDKLRGILSEGAVEAGGGGKDVRDSALSVPPFGAPFLINLGGALERCAIEFSNYKQDIVQSFADDEGRIKAALPIETFCKKLYEVTESISKSEVQVIAMRFCDTAVEAVSLPEFLEFFVTPQQAKAAKAASSAVRMSLDLLHLQEEINHDTGCSEEMEEAHQAHQADPLQRAVYRQLRMWPVVRGELDDLFKSHEKPVLDLSLFQESLSTVCGSNSRLLLEHQESMSKDKPKEEEEDKIKGSPIGGPLQKKLPAPNPPSSSGISGIISLDSNDMFLLSERFQLGGLICLNSYMQFFTEASMDLESGPKTRDSYQKHWVKVRS